MAEFTFADTVSWMGFDYDKDKVSGDEARGDCPFCGRENKFYINRVTGQWSCKSGSCPVSMGNIYTFIREWYNRIHKEGMDVKYTWLWDRLSKHRGISVYGLWDAGVAYDSAGNRFVIPVRNANGVIVNLRIANKIGARLMGLPALPTALYGEETLKGKNGIIFVCEGEWDAIALTYWIKMTGGDLGQYSIVAAPGANTFKEGWPSKFSGRKVALLYDNDEAGQQGHKYVATRLRNFASETLVIQWPPYSPEGFDVNEFVKLLMGPVGLLLSWLVIWEVSAAQSGKESQKTGPDTPRTTVQPDLSRPKPAFQTVIDCHAKYLRMSPDYEVAIRFCYAIALARDIPDRPLWGYLVGPASSGKTVILMGMSEVESCLVESTLTPNALCSGFRDASGADPSLIPKLNGKTFIFKDWTEILTMNREARDNIYSTLRGAYDGLVRKHYGSGIVRHYEPHFDMIAGVTPAVFAERSATMGERFLMLHILKGNNTQEDGAVIQALTRRFETDTAMSTELRQCARNYLEPPLAKDALDKAEDSASVIFYQKLAAMAQLVAQLRGRVERDKYTSELLYDPRVEIAARLAVQLKKLSICLALLEPDGVINERVYNIVRRVAFDTCIGFHLSILSTLASSATKQMTVKELIDATGISGSTLRLRLDDMVDLGILEIETIHTPHSRGMGKKAEQYALTDHTYMNWVKAGMDCVDEDPHLTPRMARK